MKTNHEIPPKGFTLVEILVVIVIIAVLIAIAFPVLGKMREKSNVTEGISNLRQLGALFQTFTSENNGKLPYQQSSTTNTWHIDIGEYMGITSGDFWNNRGKRPISIFACPSSKNLTRPGNYSDYGMNWLVGDHGSYSDQKRIVSVPEPSKTMLLADSVNCARRLSPYRPSGDIDARLPNDTTKVLFVDGHVEALPISKLTTDLIGDWRFQTPWGWEGWN